MIGRMTVQKLYSKLKADYAKRVGLQDVPPQFLSNFVGIGGASEQQYTLKELMGKVIGQKKILIIGLSGGRDYWYMKTLGHNVEGFDLTAPDGFEDVHVGNIEDSTTLPKKKYDFIVMGEVLEHLRDDSLGLRNVAQLLKPEGRLLLSVPFYHDFDGHDCHLHIYSPVSLERILRASGFEIERSIYRPGPFPFIVRLTLNPLHHALNLLAYGLFHKTFYHLTLPVMWRLFLLTGKSQRFNRFFKMYFGVSVKAKLATGTKYLEANIHTYWGGQ